MALISFIIDSELNSLATAFSIDIVKQSLKNSFFAKYASIIDCFPYKLFTICKHKY